MGKRVGRAHCRQHPVQRPKQGDQPQPSSSWIPAANPYLFGTGLRIHGLIDFTCSLPSPAQAERIDRELILKLTPVIAAILALGLAGCSTSPRASHSDFQHYVL